MYFELILKKATLGFIYGDDLEERRLWYDVILRKSPKYSSHFFEAGQSPDILHPQSIFGRNAFTSYLQASLDEPSINGMYLPCLVGFDNLGVAVHDFTNIIHLLISGVTGAGKSTGLYGILFSLMWLNLPKWLRIDIFATKGVRMFEDLANVYDDLPSIREGANALVERLFKRMEALKKNKHLYNIKMFNQQNKQQPMRYELIVIDEIANIYRALEGDEKERFKNNIGLIAAQGRSLGVHLIVAPQRPDASSLPSEIKSQMPSKLTFRMESQVDAQTAGQPDAVHLEKWHAIKSGSTGLRHLRMPLIEEHWVPFFAERLAKTMKINGFENGFK